jgi:Flp pilus assembly protein TadG
VEFALVSPLLIILVFGIIAFGISFAQQLSLSNAARQGARLGVVNQTTSGASTSCSAILSEVQAAAGTLAMEGTDVRVKVELEGSTTVTKCQSTASGTWTTGSAATRPCIGSGSTDRLVVTATFGSSLIIPLVTNISSWDLNGKGVYRCEYTD